MACFFYYCEYQSDFNLNILFWAYNVMLNKITRILMDILNHIKRYKIRLFDFMQNICFDFMQNVHQVSGYRLHHQILIIYTMI